MNIIIRPATLNDAETLQSLILNGISTWGKGIEENLKPWVDVVGSTEYIENNIKNPDYLIFMAEHEGKVVGTIALNLDYGDIPHMCGLYCDTKGKGIGTKLLKYSMELSRELGYKQMKCEIYDGNLPSITLMKKYGGYHAGTHTVENIDYYEYTFDLIEQEEGIMVY